MQTRHVSSRNPRQVRIGIVGSEAAKFTPASRRRACKIIKFLLTTQDVSEVVSGDCHLGGIDKWAIARARFLGIKTKEFPPKVHSWSGGYRERNLKIAHYSDKVYCITVDKLPKNYTGMRFKLCYHCGTDKHVKSGGCWTVKQAAKLGKPTKVFVVKQ